MEITVSEDGENVQQSHMGFNKMRQTFINDNGIHLSLNPDGRLE